MLMDMIHVIKSVDKFEPVVVSPDPRVLRFAAELGAGALREPGLPLNLALQWGIKKMAGKDRVLILPGDLPLLRTEDVQKLLACSYESQVVVAPSKRGGTSALLLRPPSIIAPRFGGKSFSAHLQECQRAGITPAIYRSATLEFDLDEPRDVPRFLVMGAGTRTYDFFVQLSTAGRYFITR
jgi:2-phospho-L-lactate guanylyltransferase